MKHILSSAHRWAATTVALTAITVVFAGCATDSGTEQTEAGQWQTISAAVSQAVWADTPNDRMVHRFIVSVYQKATADTLTELGIDHHKVVMANPGNPVITGNPADLRYTSVFQIAGKQYGCPNLPTDNTRLTDSGCTITIRLGGMNVSDSLWTLTPDGHHAIRVSTPKATEELESRFYKSLNSRLPKWTSVSSKSSAQ